MNLRQSKPLWAVGVTLSLCCIVARTVHAELPLPDAIIYPTWTNPPEHLDQAREEYLGDNSQLVAPATGMPAVTVPMGFTYGSLPAGLQKTLVQPVQGYPVDVPLHVRIIS